MKQKFTFEIDPENDILTLFESAEADVGSFLTVHKEEYNLKKIRKAVDLGEDAFIDKLRRRNLFPPFDIASKLFNAVTDFFDNGTETRLVVDYNDVESFPVLEEIMEVDGIEDLEDIVEVDKLLDEDENVSEDDIKEIDSDDDTPKFKPEDNSEFEK